MTPAAKILNRIAPAGTKLSDLIRNEYGSAVTKRVLKNAQDDSLVEKVKISGYVHYRITDLGRAYVWHHLGE